MIATVTALLECRPGRARSIAVALGLVLDAGVLSLTMLPGGQAAAGASAAMTRFARATVAHEVRTTGKADRLAGLAHLRPGCEDTGNVARLDCSRRNA